MSFISKIKGMSFKLPWYMYDIDNKQLITTRHIPSTIIDDKNIILSETPIPGLSYSPVTYTGIENRKLSFTLPIININDTVGNSAEKMKFDALRNEVTGFLGIFGKGQFVRNPKVLYSWGTMSIPLIYYVSKCSFSDNSIVTNSTGTSQVTNVSVELILDEEHPINKMEEAHRKVMSAIDTISGIVNLPGGI